MHDRFLHTHDFHGMKSAVTTTFFGGTCLKSLDSIFVCNLSDLIVDFGVVRKAPHFFRVISTRCGESLDPLPTNPPHIHPPQSPNNAIPFRAIRSQAINHILKRRQACTPSPVNLSICLSTYLPTYLPTPAQAPIMPPARCSPARRP